ncbi:MAG: hypothetical protein E7632_05635 [Ruminococcaceae bacterium]|nr:hypothetical protein [Oscillospiraceae bacterium]
MHDPSDFTRGVDFHDMLVYALVTIGTNFISSFASVFLQMMFFNFAASPIITALHLLVPMTTAALLTTIYFKRAVERQFLDNGGTRSWLACGLWLILPGEFVRFVFAIRPSQFAVTPGNLYSLLQERLNGNPYVVYLLIYLIYLAVYIAILLYFYHRVWRKTEIDYGKRQRKE